MHDFEENKWDFEWNMRYFETNVWDFEGNMQTREWDWAHEGANNTGQTTGADEEGRTMKGRQWGGRTMKGG